MNLEISFSNHCRNNKYEINKNQLDVIKELKSYYLSNFNQNFLSRFFKKKNTLGFYLVGDVGVGKTMILNFFFDELREKKMRLHFNEFMIKFHNFIFQNKKNNNGIDNFVKDLRKEAKVLYFDEFQVTNIVDAMILGKLFQRIFDEKIRVIFSSNINIVDLYKDGLQREQFIPFINILKNNCFQKKLSILEDYRLNKNVDLERFLFPLNESTNFAYNKFLRKMTKEKKKTKKILEIKGRNLIIENFYEKIIKFRFDELCNKNLGSEDYIAIANNAKFIFIENLPDFNENNSDQQQRFITLIDIIYEKKIPLMITSQINLKNIKSSISLKQPFKRTISRLYELTSMKYY